MNRSDTILKLTAALLLVQQEMEPAIKSSSNPFFKSKYADLNAIRDACIPLLNKHKITILQPTTNIAGKNFVETILLHEEGEWISSLTEVISDKINNAQSQGSGISYARRYGLQSLLNMGAEDDDGNAASGKNIKVDAAFIKAALAEVASCQSVGDILQLWNKYKVLQSESSFSDAMKAKKETLIEVI
ncbi:MAG: ERF family protein [Ilumatobacteraceae bacterium]